MGAPCFPKLCKGMLSACHGNVSCSGALRSVLLLTILLKIQIPPEGTCLLIRVMRTGVAKWEPVEEVSNAVLFLIRHSVSL